MKDLLIWRQQRCFSRKLHKMSSYRRKYFLAQSDSRIRYHKYFLRDSHQGKKILIIYDQSCSTTPKLIQFVFGSSERCSHVNTRKINEYIREQECFFLNTKERIHLRLMPPACCGYTQIYRNSLRGSSIQYVRKIFCKSNIF